MLSYGENGQTPFGAALVSCSSLVFTTPTVWLPSEGEMAKVGFSLLWWEAELEERVGDTQKGEVLCFRGAGVGGDRKAMQLPFLQHKKVAVMNG